MIVEIELCTVINVSMRECTIVAILHHSYYDPRKCVELYIEWHVGYHLASLVLSQSMQKTLYQVVDDLLR